MKKYQALLLATAVMMAPGLAVAQEQPVGEFSGTMTLTSDYVYRGISQTDEHPALQGSFDYEMSNGLYAGVWASNVDFNDGNKTSLEIDVYGGYKFESSGLNWDIGMTGFVYPGSNQGSDHYNYIEGKLAATKTIGTFETTAAAYWSPDYFGDSGDATYLGIDTTTPIMDSDFSFNASFGHQWISKNAVYGLPDAYDWSAGIGYAWNGFDFGLKYTDTDISKNQCPGGECGARAIVSVSRSFD